MRDLFNSFLLTFVPLFIVIDAVGNLPIIVSLGEGKPKSQKRRLIGLATTTATLVGLAFLFLGKLILILMGISMGSFTIAGGTILIVLAVRYMTTGHKVDVLESEMVAVAPIGTPLTVGPATITTLLLLTDQFPVYVVLLSFALNMVLTWVIFIAGDTIGKLIGRNGMTAISRIVNLLLAAIGVNMVIRGLTLIGILK